jgi:hypothetical protein
MKLSQRTREQICEDILRDAPDASRAILQELDTAVQEYVWSRLPGPVQKLRGSGHSHFLKMHQIYFRGDYGFERDSIRVPTPVPCCELVGQARSDEAIMAIAERYWQACEQRENLAKLIRAHLDGCTTIAQFEDRFPELAAYAAPYKVQPTRNLPATTELIDALRANGPQVGAPA